MTEVTFLHGFTQTSSAWAAVVDSLGNGYRCRAPDLPGHGLSLENKFSSTQDFVEATERTIEIGLEAAADKRVLVGYSMGARLALTLCLDKPKRWDALVLISSGAGLTGHDQRKQRRESDLALAQRIEVGGIEAFDQEWNSLALWAEDPADVSRLRTAMLLTQEPALLARVLNVWGQGTAPSTWDRLDEITIPTRVLVGGRDQAYADTAQLLALALSGCGKADVLDGGHSLPLENPTQVAEIISELAEEISRRQQPAGP
ncbi:MAG: alpha/beta fold hydrolase [Solirubrobacterales bacterium]|nr:alpha/beta fold hydrolase [Solirubrobacterales bacterium]